MQTEDDVLVSEGPPGIGADAAAVFGRVIGSRSTRGALFAESLLRGSC
jgi:hypothetical protein